MNSEIVSIFATFFSGLTFFATLICFAVAAIKFLIKSTGAKKWLRFAEINFLVMLVLQLIQIASDSYADFCKVLDSVAFASVICFIGKKVYEFARKKNSK